MHRTDMCLECIFFPFIAIRKEHIIFAKFLLLLGPCPLRMVGLPVCIMLASIKYWPQRRVYDAPCTNYSLSLVLPLPPCSMDQVLTLALGICFALPWLNRLHAAQKPLAIALCGLLHSSVRFKAR